MEIIKPGDLSRIKLLRYYRAECPECGCVFRFNDREMDRSCGAWHSSASVECPCCHENINYHSRNVVLEKSVKPE